MNVSSKFKKNGILALSTVLALTMVVALFVAFAPASSVAQGGDGAYNPAEYLSQFRGRQFPNEVPPRDDIVAAQAAGVSLDDSDAAVLLDQWYKDFAAKKEKSGPNPMAFDARMKALEAAQSKGRGLQAVEAISGTAEMLMIPIEFNATDDIAACDTLGGTQTATATVTGPLFGTIPDPALDGDNRTMYAPGGNFTTQWYNNLMFGNGVGVVRTDLNGGAGVDMTGVSASNFYQEQSEGMYNLAGEVFSNVIQLDHSVAYYGWDGDEAVNGVVPCNGTPSGYGFEFVTDAAAKLNQLYPNFDWSQYDVHGPGDEGPPDGIVDHLMIIHAGVDNSAGGGTLGDYQLWAHSWDVYCDKGNGLSIGCLVQGGDTVTTTDDIYIANYTHIPEDADIGVVVHEYGHDIGLPDYYDQTGATSNSTAQWILMSGGSWSGMLGGSHPAPFNPWGRYFFGWATPKTISYTTAMTEVTIGQSDPTPSGTEDSVWIELPDQAVQVDNLAGDGPGLHAVLGNELLSSLNKTFDLSAATAPVFTFTTDLTIEEDWDYAYVRASTDGGSTWTVLLNNEGFYATTDPNGSFAWLGAGGLTGAYAGTLTYDLSAYAGQSAVTLEILYATDQAVQEAGIWVDNFALTDGSSTLYSSDLTDPSDWNFSPTEWEVVPYNELYPHYYMLEWRNNTGSIASVGSGYQYYSLAHSQDGWKVDNLAADTPGLLVWYRNNKYSNNQAAAGGREYDLPAFGPKGELLLVDSHPDPVTWSGGWWDATAGDTAPTFSNRRGAMDAAFTLDTTPAWMIHDYAVFTDTVMDFGSRPAVSTFSDGNGWAPGWVFPGDGFVYRADKSASVVIPAKGEYGTRVRGLANDGVNLGDDVTWLWAYTVGGRRLGSGNPADYGVQFGVTVDLIDQAPDGSWGKVRIGNQNVVVDSSGTDTVLATDSGTFTVTYTVVFTNQGTGPASNVGVDFTLDSDLTPVSLSATGGAGTANLPGTSWWTDSLPAGQSVEVTLVATGDNDLNGSFGTGALPYSLHSTADAYAGTVNFVPMDYVTDVFVPYIHFVMPVEGDTVFTNTVDVEVDLPSFFDIGNGSSFDGHWHLSVDGGAETPIFTTTTTINLSAGEHTLQAKLVDSNHGWLGPVETINVSVLASGTADDAGVIGPDGGSFTTTDPSGTTFTLDIPAGVLPGNITFGYSQLAPSSGTFGSFGSGSFAAPGNYFFSQYSFQLNAYQNGSLLSGFTFASPVTLTMVYTDSDVVGLDETTLILTTYNATSGLWEDAACGDYVRDPANNTLQVPICHLSDFAAAGQKNFIYLPVVMKGFTG